MTRQQKAKLAKSVSRRLRKCLADLFEIDKADVKNEGFAYQARNYLKTVIDLTEKI